MGDERHRQLFVPIIAGQARVRSGIPDFAAINYGDCFVIAALPETSNKSLEQLEEELSANKSAAGFNTATKENGL